MNELKTLYQEAIRRHAAEPTGFRRAIAATHRYEGHNPQCGDRVEISLKLSSGMIEDIAFDGEACTICMASASLLCDQLAGKEIAVLDSMQGVLVQALEGGRDDGDIGPLAPLTGVRPYPSRIQCALLPWESAARALDSPL